MSACDRPFSVCAGVVYRLKDTALVLAVEDVPEEGMDQPLRIEKLANEVTMTWIQVCVCVCWIV
jgi:hypothetical protein